MLANLKIAGLLGSNACLDAIRKQTMKISDQLVQLYLLEEYDKSILVKESFLVNLRLYKISKDYKNIILTIVAYMDEHLNSKFEDWKDPIGVAACNLGFPFKIIGYKSGLNTPKCQYCLNPKITLYAGVEQTAQGNCGSLQLKEPLSVKRNCLIDFEFYDLEGNLVVKKSISRSEGAFTIQNEIDQINGITVEIRHTLSEKNILKENLGVKKNEKIDANEANTSYYAPPSHQRVCGL